MMNKKINQPADVFSINAYRYHRPSGILRLCARDAAGALEQVWGDGLPVTLDNLEVFNGLVYEPIPREDRPTDKTTVTDIDFLV